MAISIEHRNLSQVAQVQHLIHPSAQPVLRAEGEPLIFSAICDGQVCGALVAAIEGDEGVVYSLFVDPSFRRNGVGRALISALRQGLEGLAVTSLFTQWALPEEDCQGLEGFLTQVGFQCEREENPIYRIFSGDLSKSPMLRGAFLPNYRPAGNIIPVSQWTQVMWDELMADTSIPHALHPAPFRGVMWEEVSAGYYYDGHIVAYFLLKEAGAREVALLPALSRKGAHPAAILQLLSAALNYCRRYYQGDFSIWTNTINDQSKMLVEHLAMGKAVAWWSGEGVLTL